jgi:uncharacterized protein (DUF1501 family)
MSITRRHFIAGSSSLMLAGNWASDVIASQRNKKNLIVIMLRGGMDGLTAVPFIGNNQLADLRPSINVEGANKIDGSFALHPILKNFKSQWDEGTAAILHASSIPYTGRSHFEGQNLMETGGLTPYNDYTGWLGRGMESAGMKALSISLPMPLLLRGNIDNDNFYPSKRPMPSADVMALLAQSYHGEDGLMRAMAKVRARPVSMAAGSGDNKDIDSLAKTAALQIRQEGGPSVAVFDLGGFDTHSFQGGDKGEHADELEKYDRAIGTLKRYLGTTYGDTIIATLTEFGRTVAQNGGSGTEHGYGTALLLAGGLLPSSRMLGDWPGLKKEALYEGRDLAATIDVRAAYASIMGHVFDRDHKLMCSDAFYGANLPDLSKAIFG